MSKALSSDHHAGRVPEQVELFLTALASDRVETVRRVLAPDVSVAFSTVGVAEGAGGVVDLLTALRSDFDLASTVLTNVMHVHDTRFDYHYATGHHLQGYCDGKELYTLSFGGKYAFATERTTDLIRSARFDLEYLTGNTHWTRGRWDVRLNNGRDRLISGRLLRPSQSAAELAPDQVASRLFWAWDTADRELLGDCSADSIRWTSQRVGASIGAMTGRREIQDAVTGRSATSNGPLSVAFVEKQQRSALAVRLRGRRLNPGNTGNKHRGGRTTHALFFDEDVELTVEHKRWQVAGGGRGHATRGRTPSCAERPSRSSRPRRRGPRAALILAWTQSTPPGSRVPGGVGAACQNRTDDLIITSDSLYRLS